MKSNWDCVESKSTNTLSNFFSGFAIFHYIKWRPFSNMLLILLSVCLLLYNYQSLLSNRLSLSFIWLAIIIRLAQILTINRNIIFTNLKFGNICLSILPVRVSGEFSRLYFTFHKRQNASKTIIIQPVSIIGDYSGTLYNSVSLEVEYSHQHNIYQTKPIIFKRHTLEPVRISGEFSNIPYYVQKHLIYNNIISIVYSEIKKRR